MKTEIYFGEESKKVLDLHCRLLQLHYQALACHCECLGMNAENSIAVCMNTTPPYTENEYFEVMKKWGLRTESGDRNL